MDITRRIVVADDHTLFLESFCERLGMLLGDTAPEPHSSLDSVYCALSQKPPVALAIVDLYMPGSDGVDTISDLVETFPNTGIVIISGRLARMEVLKYAKTGIAGVLLKDMCTEEVVVAIRQMLDGGTYLPPNILDVRAGSIDMPYTGHRITEREYQILSLIHDALSNKGIARELDIAEPTVKMHVRQLFKKYSAKNRIELALKSAEDLLSRSSKTKDGSGLSHNTE